MRKTQYHKFEIYFFSKNTLTLKFLYSKVNTIKLKQMIVEQIMAKSNVTTFHNWGSISFLLLSVEAKTDSFGWHGQFRSLLSRKKTWIITTHTFSPDIVCLPCSSPKRQVQKQLTLHEKIISELSIP